MKNKPAFTFETLGQLPMKDAVAGYVSYKDSQRLVCVVLTEEATSHKRKEKLGQTRLQLNENIISIEGNKRPQKAFLSASAPQIKVSIKNPEDAGPGIQYILSETDQPIIIVDCQSKACFWAILKTLGVDNEMLFSLAELEALKPQKKITQQKKSIGTVHELCATLSRNIVPGRDNSNAKETIQQIRHAKKYIIPGFNLFEQEKIARIHSMMNPGIAMRLAFQAAKAATYATVFAGKLAGLFGIKALPKTKREYVVAAHKRALEMNKRRNPNTSVTHYEQMIKLAEKFTDEQIDLIVNNPASEIGDPLLLTEILQQNSVFQYTNTGYFDLNVRNGYHFLPYDNCLFEFDLIQNGSESADKVYALAKQSGNQITFTFYMKLDEIFVRAKSHAIATLDENMQVINWSEIDNQTGEKKTSKVRSLHDSLGEEKANIVPGLMAHVLGICALINEPGYSGHIVIPTGGKIRPGKHAFPYFDYEFVEMSPSPTQIRTVSNRLGQPARVSPVFHKVARHVRTIKRGTPDEQVIIVSPHTRGDISKGVKSTAIKLKV